MFNTVPIVRFEQTHFNFNFTLVNSYKKNHLMKLANLYSNNKFKKKNTQRNSNCYYRLPQMRHC